MHLDKSLCMWFCTNCIPYVLPFYELDDIELKSIIQSISVETYEMYELCKSLEIEPYAVEEEEFHTIMILIRKNTFTTKLILNVNIILMMSFVNLSPIKKFQYYPY